MVELNDYPPGVPCWVDTLQPDVDAAMRFYGGLMGWTFEGPGEMPDVPSGRYYVARLRGRDVARAGGKVVVPPFEIPRFRQAVLADPQGAVFTVAQPMAKG